jgi:hypothetical protein
MCKECTVNYGRKWHDLWNYKFILCIKSATHNIFHAFLFDTGWTHSWRDLIYDTDWLCKQCVQALGRIYFVGN